MLEEITSENDNSQGDGKRPQAEIDQQVKWLEENRTRIPAEKQKAVDAQMVVLKGRLGESEIDAEHIRDFGDWGDGRGSEFDFAESAGQWVVGENCEEPRRRWEKVIKWAAQRVTQEHEMH